MIDGRLLVAAAAAWSGVVAATWGLGLVDAVTDRHAVAGGVLRACCALLAVGAAILVARRQSVIGIAFSLVALGAAAGAWHVHAVTSEPVAGWASARVTATIEADVTGEPVLRRADRSWQAEWVEVPVATSRVAARGEAVDVGVPMVARVRSDAVIPAPGARVRLVGRLSLSSLPGVVANVTTTASQPFVTLRAPGVVDTSAHAMRMALRSAASKVPRDAGALVAGLATGDDSLQSTELADDMKASGLSHLTAVSGGNVAIVLAVVLAIAAVVGVSLVMRVAVALAALAYFVVLVGPQPSVLRAAVMGSVVVAALLAGGRRAGPSVLAAAVTLLVLVSPPLAGSWGFALSVFATAGLILLAPVVDGWLAGRQTTRRWPPALRRAVALAAAAQLATLPLLVAMGSTVGWVSLPANLLAMPAVAPVTVAGLAAALVGPLLPAVADWLTHAAAVPAGWIALVAHTSADLPGAAIPWPAGPGGVTVLAVLAALVAFGLVLVRRIAPAGFPRAARMVWVGALVSVLLLWCVAPPSRRAWPPPHWLLIMCDVGQGDAILLRDGARSAVLVDAGPDPDRLDGCLDDAQVASVSAVVLTHFHADHVDGLAGAFRDRDVGPVLVNPVRDPPDRAAAVDEVLAAIGHSTAEAISAGDRRRVGDVEWEALWPRRRIAAGSVANNASIVLAVRAAAHTVLLTGDIEPEAQAALDLGSRSFEVVKVPHHGSRYEQPQFAQSVHAPVALISVGAGNDYGHPAAETIARWEAAGATVLRTDESGDIAVVSIPETDDIGVATRR